jgi:histidyl-tRNA synthetase
MGIERLVALLEEQQLGDTGPAVDVYLVLMGEAAERQGMVLAERLRDELPGLRLITHCGGGSFKSQFKRADRSGAGLALVLGEEEAAAGMVAVKPLRGDGEQTRVEQAKLAGFLKDKLGS